MVVFGLFVFLFFAFWVYPVLLFLQARFPAFQAFAKIVTGKDRTKFFRVILRNAFETYFNGYVYLFENRIVTQIHRVRFSFVQPRLAWERRWWRGHAIWEKPEACFIRWNWNGLLPEDGFRLGLGGTCRLSGLFHPGECPDSGEKEAVKSLLSGLLQGFPVRTWRKGGPSHRMFAYA